MKYMLAPLIHDWVGEVLSLLEWVMGSFDLTRASWEGIHEEVAIERTSAGWRN